MVLIILCKLRTSGCFSLQPLRLVISKREGKVTSSLDCFAIFSSIIRIVKGTNTSYSKVNTFLVSSPGRDYLSAVCVSINASLEDLPSPPAPGGGSRHCSAASPMASLTSPSSHLGLSSAHTLLHHSLESVSIGTRPGYPTTQSVNFTFLNWAAA